MSRNSPRLLPGVLMGRGVQQLCTAQSRRAQASAAHHVDPGVRTALEPESQGQVRKFAIPAGVCARVRDFTRYPHAPALRSHPPHQRISLRRVKGDMYVPPGVSVTLVRSRVARSEATITPVTYRAQLISGSKEGVCHSSGRSVAQFGSQKPGLGPLHRRAYM